MPVTAKDIKTHSSEAAIIWTLERKKNDSGATGSISFESLVDGTDFFRSNPYSLLPSFDCTHGSPFSSNSNKEFIKFDRLFKQQFQEHKISFEGISFGSAKDKMTVSLNSLLETNPDALSMEVTNEQSIFYSLKKDIYSFYIQHFLNEIDADEDEVIVTGFKGNEKLPSFAGSLTETIQELNAIIPA